MFQNDTIVYPKESAWFGTYDVGKIFKSMKETLVYKDDYQTKLLFTKVQPKLRFEG